MLAWLYSTQMFGIKLGLENTRRLLALLDHPERDLTFLHVAGTNGKGSVCAMLASILQTAGHCTGLFTSPHLREFRERIQINGIPLSREATALGLGRIREATRDWQHAPTFFEISLALALRNFSDLGCEFVVLETGMGGRWDATNAITPLVTIFTPIAMDHSQWLGDSLEKIAGEKAGILKPGIPAVSARQEPEVRGVFNAAAAEQGSPLVFVTEPWDGDLGLKGVHQRDNAALAVAALQIAGIPVDDLAIADGLRGVQWPGRFQCWGRNLVLDGAHNPHAARVLSATWKSQFGEKRARVIFGGLSDKNLPEMLRILEPIAGEFIFVPVRSPRSESSEVLARHTTLPCRAMSGINEALREAMDAATPTLVTGSLYLIGEALAYLHGEARPLETSQ